MNELGALRFEDPWALGLLAAVAVGIALNLIRARRTAPGLLFSSVGILPSARTPWRVRLRWTLVALRVLALVLFIVALARPLLVRASVESVS